MDETGDLFTLDAKCIAHPSVAEMISSWKFTIRFVNIRFSVMEFCSQLRICFLM
jgi:hypothetical protein